MRSWTRWTLVVVVALSACGGSSDEAPSAVGPAVQRPQENRETDPRLVALLASEPSAEALEYLSQNVLFTDSESEFVSSMCTLAMSGSPQVAMLAADVLSTGYHILGTSEASAADAISASLKTGSTHLRRIVTRNLGQCESPQVRQWLKGRADDDAVDLMHAPPRTVSEEARLSSERLDRAKREGLSVSPSDARDTVVGTLGTSVRVPVRDTPFDLVVEISDIRSAVTSTSRPREPLIDSLFTVVARGNDMRVGVLRLDSVSIYAGGFLKTDDLLMFVWCRPIGKDRVRCWYRIQVAPAEK